MAVASAITPCGLWGFVQDFLKPKRFLLRGRDFATLRRQESNRQAWGHDPRFTRPQAQLTKEIEAMSALYW